MSSCECHCSIHRHIWLWSTWLRSMLSWNKVKCIPHTCYMYMDSCVLIGYKLRVKIDFSMWRHRKRLKDWSWSKQCPGHNLWRHRHWGLRYLIKWREIKESFTSIQCLYYKTSSDCFIQVMDSGYSSRSMMISKPWIHDPGASAF